MKKSQLLAVCNSYDKACELAPDFGSRFYQQLSLDHPEIQKVFISFNMEAQHTRFVSLLGVILHRMKNNWPVTSLLQDLGAQHRGFGVKEEHFEAFGSILLKVLQETLDKDFSAALHDSWAEAYGEITRVMTKALSENSEN